MARAHYIVGVHVTNRAQNVPEVQKVLTEFGCAIRTRLGLHEVQEDSCSPNGMLILDLVCDDETCRQMMAKLGAIAGLDVQRMVFTHD